MYKIRVIAHIYLFSSSLHLFFPVLFHLSAFAKFAKKAETYRVKVLVAAAAEVAVAATSTTMVAEEHNRYTYWHINDLIDLLSYVRMVFALCFLSPSPPPPLPLPSTAVEWRFSEVALLLSMPLCVGC